MTTNVHRVADTPDVIRRPDYPDQVSGMQIYTAVLDDGVRTPERFAAWLTERES